MESHYVVIHILKNYMNRKHISVHVCLQSPHSQAYRHACAYAHAHTHVHAHNTCFFIGPRN